MGSTVVGEDALRPLRDEVERGWELNGPDKPTAWSELLRMGTILQLYAMLAGLLLLPLWLLSLSGNSQLEWLVAWSPVPIWIVLVFAAPMSAYTYVNQYAEELVRSDARGQTPVVPIVPLAFLSGVHRALRWSVLAISTLTAVALAFFVVFGFVSAYERADLKLLTGIAIVLLAVVAYQLATRR